MRPAAALTSALLAAVFAVSLAGCASAPGGAGRERPPARPAPAATSPDRDGPGLDPPADVDRRPDAEPRIEPVRPGGANKPYQALGRDYVPLPADSPLAERGLASWYGRKFHGRPTASGERYDMYAMTAAHPTLPIPSYARVRNPANGKEVVVRINDRGPFHANRIVDLSYAAAAKLDLLRGVAPVELQRITWDEIRAGTWRRDAPVLAAAPRPEPSKAASLPSPSPSPSSTLGPSSTSPPTQATTPDAVPVPAEAVVTVAAVEPTSPAAATATAAPRPEPPPSPRGEPAPGFWVQLGAFREPAGAESFQRRVGAELEAIASRLATFADAAAAAPLYRVQAGPYPRRDDAVEAAARIRSAIGVVPLIVEKAGAR